MRIQRISIFLRFFLNGIWRKSKKFFFSHRTFLCKQTKHWWEFRMTKLTNMLKNKISSAFFLKLFYMAVFRKHYSPAKALIQFQHCYLDILSSCFTPNLFCKDSVRKWTNWPLFNHQLLLPNSCPRPQKIDPDNCDYWQGIDRVILESNDQSVPWHATYCTLDRELGKKCLGRILLESKTLRRPNLLRQGFRTMQSVVKKLCFLLSI